MMFIFNIIVFTPISNCTGLARDVGPKFIDEQFITAKSWSGTYNQWRPFCQEMLLFYLFNIILYFIIVSLLIPNLFLFKKYNKIFKKFVLFFKIFWNFFEIFCTGAGLNCARSKVGQIGSGRAHASPRSGQRGPHPRRANPAYLGPTFFSDLFCDFFLEFSKVLSRFFL